MACVEYVLACIELDVNQLVALLVALQRPFGAAQLGVELFDTVVDKLLGTASHLILVLIGLAVVDYGQLAQIVGSAHRHFVVECELGDGGRLGCGRYVERLLILV